VAVPKINSENIKMMTDDQNREILALLEERLEWGQKKALDELAVGRNVTEDIVDQAWALVEIHDVMTG
jgi:hypothetical protein